MKMKWNWNESSSKEEMKQNIKEIRIQKERNEGTK